LASYYNKLENIIQLITDRTGLTNIVPGTTAYQIAQAFAYEAYQQELKIDINFENNSISSAVGPHLDKIGSNFFGIERIQAQKPYISSSMKTLKFSTTGDRPFGAVNNDEDIILPRGTVISGTGVRFVLDQEYILPASYIEYYVSASLIQGPNDIIQSNVLTEHSFTNYSDYKSKSLLVTNTMPIITGRPKESDEDYRYRIKNYLRLVNQSNLDGVLNIIRSVKGVSDAYVYPAKDGAGTFTAYVQGITPITSDDVIGSVKLALMQNCVTPWVDFNVVKPDYIGISLSANISLISTTNVTNTVQFTKMIKSGLESYINNFSGSELYILDLKRVILNMSSDIADVDITVFKTFRGTDELRQSETVNLDEIDSITIFDQEKVVVEPITDAIIVNI